MAFDYASLIQQYGYVATFAGTLIEGESLLILAGLAAHRGYLSLPLVVIVGARFMYGLRTAGPAIIGTTRMTLLEFIPLNVVGALLWSACWAGAGYRMGRAAEHLLGDLAQIERELFGGALVVVVIGVVTAKVWRARGRR